MSTVQRYPEKPKVRFSQRPDCVQSDSSRTSTDTRYRECHSAPNRPRIRSIVTLEKPVKVTRLNCKVPTNSESITENATTKCAVTTTADDRPLATCKSPSRVSDESSRNSNRPSSEINECTSQFNILCERDNNTVGLSVAENHCETKKASSQKTDSINDQFTVREPLSGDRKNNIERNNWKKNTQSVPISKSSKVTSLAKHNKIKTGMETNPNVCTPKSTLKPAVSMSMTSTASKVTGKIGSKPNTNLLQQTSCKNLLTTSRSREKTPKTVTTMSRNGAIGKTLAGSKMPKSNTRVSKACRKATNPVKKTILRNIDSYPPQVYVGPGIQRPEIQHYKLPKSKEPSNVRPNIMSAEQLSRPEYNSIMCTINKMREVEKEKIVRDVEHLPPMYRNMINEKVTAALDFSPAEVIYKDLVELTIDENQLPSRLTRSKDPEPRHKDIVPTLSDFYTPTYSEEYCTAVPIRVHTPETVSNWSAFAISDKIFGWKHDMDQYY